MDLSGGKMSEDSFTTSMTALVEEYKADIQLDWFGSAAPSSVVRSEGSKCSSCPGMDRLGSVAMEWPVLHGELVRFIDRDFGVHVLSGSRPCEAEGTGVDDAGDPIASSDLTRGNTAVFASTPSTGSASLFALLRARRFFHFAERNFRMTALDQRRWWGDSERRRPIASEGHARVHVAFPRHLTVPYQ